MKKYWPSQIADSYRGMRALKDYNGVVFDIYEDQFDRFMDNYNHLKETSKIDFTVSKCNELPELAEENGFETEAFGSWRGGNNDGGFN